jgi:hypothetical protein
LAPGADLDADPVVEPLPVGAVGVGVWSGQHPNTICTSPPSISTNAPCH